MTYRCFGLDNPCPNDATVVAFLPDLFDTTLRAVLYCEKCNTGQHSFGRTATRLERGDLEAHVVGAVLAGFRVYDGRDRVID